MKPTSRKNERGQTILLVAISLVAMLGMAALAIDVVTLYVARAEAQRAADAGALAGAQMLVDTGLTTDPCNPALANSSQTLATNQAILAAQQNNIAGQPAQAVNIHVTFPNGTATTSCPNAFGINPQITVNLQRTNLPTFFSRIWSRGLGTVSAVATAEGYNPSNSSSLNSTGSVIPIAPRCAKPIILPNCDPSTLHTINSGSACTGGPPFINAISGAIINPGQYPAGVIGEPFSLIIGGAPPPLISGCDPTMGGTCLTHPGPGKFPAAGKYYPLDLTPGALHLCPSCATGTAGFQADVECCNASTLTCGQQYSFDNTVNPEKDIAIQPAGQCLIHELPGNGQDIYDPSTQSPTLFIAGDNNPFVGTSVQANDHIMTSDSVVTVALYDGTFIPSAGSVFTVIGYLQLFIDTVDGTTGKISAHILNVSGCGSSPSGTAVQGASTSVPVRLIQMP